MQAAGKLQFQSRVWNRVPLRCRGLRILLFVALCGYTASHSVAQILSSSERMACAVIVDQQDGRPATISAQVWTLAKGEQLKGMDAAWYNTANGDYLRFVKRSVDDLLENGTAADSDAGSLSSLDQGLLGGQLLRGDVVMATVRYAHGTVFAAVDPWLYNENTDGRKNPHVYSQFDNFAGGKGLVHRLVQQRPSKDAGTRERSQAKP
jgi:hypothetical protein